MKNTIQLYIDKKKQVKGYPITSTDRVMDASGKSVKTMLQDNVKFDIVEESEEVAAFNKEVLDKVEKINEQLNNKANKNEVIKKGNITLDECDEKMLAAIQNKEGETAFNLLNIPRDGSVNYEKTDFLKHGKNFVNTKDVETGIINQIGELVTTGMSVDNYYTIGYKKITKGMTYVGKYVRKFVAFNSNKEVIPESFIDNTNHLTDKVNYTAAEDGYIRLSFRKDLADSVQFEQGNEPTAHERYHIYFDNDEECENYINGRAIKDRTIEPIKTSFLIPTKNKFDKKNVQQGYILMSGGLSPMDKITENYFTSDFIYIEKGKTYSVNNIRKALYFTETKGITAKYVDEKLASYTFTAQEKGYIRFSFHKDYLDIVQFEENVTCTAYESYGYKYNIPIIQSTQEKNKLKGKTIYAFGTSITWGHLTGRSYIDYLAEDNDMKSIKYARNGNKVIGNKDTINTILWQIAGASSTLPDFIIFDGLANDCYNDKPRGTITPNFKSELDESTFCGAFESICKTLMTKYRGVPIIYVNVHKLVGREYSIQDEFQDLATQVCKKWGVEVVDLYHSGMNTFIESIKLEYSYKSLDDMKNGGGTHPNEEGYRKYYCPPIKATMESLI